MSPSPCLHCGSPLLECQDGTLVNLLCTACHRSWTAGGDGTVATLPEDCVACLAGLACLTHPAVGVRMVPVESPPPAELVAAS